MVKNHKIVKKYDKNMRGGNYSQEEYDQLINLGFAQNQIELFQNLSIPYNEVIQYTNEISNQDEGFHGNSDDLTEQVTDELYNTYVLNNSNISNVPQNLDEQYFMDIGDDSQGSLHLSDLEASQNSSNGYTTNEDFSQGEGGTKKRKRAKKNGTKKNKKSKIKKNKKCKTKKNKKTKIMKGGQEDKPKEGSFRLYKDENPQF
jgi:hypothetical protein